MNNDNFTLSNVKVKNELTEHFAFTTTILFQLKGQTKVLFKDVESNITKGDIIIINRNTNYFLIDNQDINNVLIKLNIDNSYFISIYDEFLNTLFEYYPAKRNSGKISYVNELKMELSSLIISYANYSSTNKINTSIILNKIILLLVSYFRKRSDTNSPYVTNNKIVEVLKYIDKNYHKDITMEKLSDKIFMSPPSLSKLFKEETGILFNVYLNKLRVNRSLKDLLYSRMTIEEIALGNGFKNSRTYRRRFKEVFNESPSKYRSNKNTKKDTKCEKDRFILEDSEEIFETLYSYISLPEDPVKKNYIASNNKEISINNSIDREQILPNKIVHIGSLEMLLQSDVVRELKMTLNDIGMDYIGVSNIYDNFPKTYLSDEVEEYYVFSDYGKFDSIIEGLIKNSIGLFYQIKLRDVARRQDNSFVQIYEFLKHIKNLYNGQLLKNIKLNLILDINNIKQDFKIFMKIYRKIKEIDREISIGASIPCTYPNYEFLNKEDEKLFVGKISQYCEFLSFTSDPNIIYDRNENEIVNMELYNEYVYKETGRVKDILDKWNISLPLYLTEWNTLTGKKQSINGTFFRGAIMLQEILKLDLYIEAYGFWLNSGLYKNYKLDKDNKYNGLELFHNYSGKKPIYNVLTLASRLKGRVRALGKEHMLLQDRENYQLLLWNPNYFNPKLSEQLKFLETKAMTYNIEVADIKDNYYQIKRFDLSRYDGAIYYNFQNFKSRYPIDMEARRYISDISIPKMSIFDVNIIDGFKFSFRLDTNAIILLEFRPIYN